MMNDEPGSKSDYFETPNLVKFALHSGMRFSNAQVYVCYRLQDTVFNLVKHQLRLSMIRVGMNTDHINHEDLSVYQKQKKN